MATAVSASARVRTLAEQVSLHMTEVFPDSEFGGWLVAEDHRDGSAVAVWRQREWGGMEGVRGHMLYRWLLSLRDAGFTAEPRTDMEVFGRPDDQSEDGRAHWLHITAKEAA